MDEVLLLISGSCLALAVLVYLMWKSAMKEEWGELAQTEKKKWRIAEENRKEAALPIRGKAAKKSS